MKSPKKPQNTVLKSWTTKFTIQPSHRKPRSYTDEEEEEEEND